MEGLGKGDGAGDCKRVGVAYAESPVGYTKACGDIGSTAEESDTWR